MERLTRIKAKKESSPLILLTEEILLRHVDEIDHGLGGNEQLVVEDFNLENRVYFKVQKVTK